MCIEVQEVPNKPDSFCLVITNNKKKTFKAGSILEKHQWVNTIILHIVAMRDNRFDSFAPARPDTHALWFVDGKDTYAAIHEACMHATTEIFITAWGLVPMLYLKRGKDSQNARLDQLLQTKADQGIKIFIILWKEEQLAQLSLESVSVAQYFESLHPNISVVIHPQTTLPSVRFTSYYLVFFP